jgi:hypothetical protein
MSSLSERNSVEIIHFLNISFHQNLGEKPSNMRTEKSFVMFLSWRLFSEQNSVNAEQKKAFFINLGGP